jgi:hypothetical protein
VHELHHHHSFPVLKTFVITFMAGRQRLFKLFSLFGEQVCIHCSDCSLVSTFTYETQFHHLLLVPRGSELRLSLWYRSESVKAETILVLVYAREKYANPSCTKLVAA